MSPSVSNDKMVSIDTMTRAEACLTIALAEREGWNPGRHDATIFHALNAQGLLCIHYQGQPVGFSSVMVYDRNYAFFGLYIVEKEFRGEGYGMAMTRQRLKIAGSRCIGLDGVTENVNMYARIGFRSTYKNLRFAFNADCMERLVKTASARLRHDISIVPLNTVSSHLLTAFDHHFFPASRGAFLNTWCQQPDSLSLAAQHQGQLVGYIVVRPCINGSKIGPLFAQSRSIAESLLVAAASHSSRLPLYIDMPEPNRHAIDIAYQSHMTPISETVRMYIGTPRPFDLSGVYGITSLEMG